MKKLKSVTSSLNELLILFYFFFKTSGSYFSKMFTKFCLIVFFFLIYSIIEKLRNTIRYYIFFLYNIHRYTKLKKIDNSKKCKVVKQAQRIETIENYNDANVYVINSLNNMILIYNKIQPYIWLYTHILLLPNKLTSIILFIFFLQ